MEDLSRIIRTEIRTIRIEKGLTIEDLAGLADIDASFLGKIERNTNCNITLGTLEKIIQAFSISYDEFFMKCLDPHFQLKENEKASDIKATSLKVR